MHAIQRLCLSKQSAMLCLLVLSLSFLSIFDSAFNQKDFLFAIPLGVQCNLHLHFSISFRKSCPYGVLSIDGPKIYRPFHISGEKPKHLISHSKARTLYHLKFPRRRLITDVQRSLIFHISFIEHRTQTINYSNYLSYYPFEAVLVVLSVP